MTKETRQTKAVTFRLSEDLTAAMQRLHDRDGINDSEMMRRALTAFLEGKGVLKPGRKPSAKGAA